MVKKSKNGLRVGIKVVKVLKSFPLRFTVSTINNTFFNRIVVSI